MQQLTLKDIKTLKEVSTEYDIPIQTLHSRLKNLIEGEDYKLLGKRQATILSKEGVLKITNTI